MRGVMLVMAALVLGCMPEPGGFCTVLECGGGMTCVRSDPGSEGADLFCAWRCGSSSECAPGCACGWDFAARDGGGACYAQTADVGFDWTKICKDPGNP